MKQYEVLTAKKLFAGSDIIRRFGYKTGGSQDNYALFQKADCFVFHSPLLYK